MDKVSYAMGMAIARNLTQSGVSKIDINDFSAGLQASLEGKKTELTSTEANSVLEEYFKNLEAERAAEEAEVAKAMKEDGEKFLAENAKKEGVVVLPDGLQYKVIKQGSGKKAGRRDTVRCHYEGRFTNGQIFDSSYKRGEPAEFGITQVIAGWTEALQLMPEGSVWELYIPYKLGYGEAGAHGAIPPCAALIFKVEVLKVL